MSINPKPSCHVCPDFSISPPPDGHITLGSVLKNLNADGFVHPLNVNAVIEIPIADVFPRDAPHTVTGFSRTLRELCSVEGSIWAKLLDPIGPGGKLSLLRSKSDDETLTVGSLQTRYFIPTEEYMKKTLETPGVAMFVNVTKMKVPIYLVTGLKIAVGAKLTNTQTRSKKGSIGAAATDPGTGITAGSTAAHSSGHSVITGFDGSKPFVLGVRVRKIWWQQKGGGRLTSDSVAGALLGDSDSDDGPDLLDGLAFEDDLDGGFEEILEFTGVEPCRWIFS